MPKRKLEGTKNHLMEDFTYLQAIDEYKKVYSEWVKFCDQNPDFVLLNFKKKRDYEDFAYLSLQPDLAIKLCN